MKIDEPAITLATMCHDVDDERSGELAHARPRPIAVLENSLGNARRLHKEEDTCTFIDFRILLYIGGGVTRPDDQASLMRGV